MMAEFACKLENIHAIIGPSISPEGATVCVIDKQPGDHYVGDIADKAGFITGENICIDGGMPHQMIYHDDCGWKLEEKMQYKI